MMFNTFFLVLSKIISRFSRSTQQSTPTFSPTSGMPTLLNAPSSFSHTYPMYPTVPTQKYISSSPHGIYIYNSNCYLTKVYIPHYDRYSKAPAVHTAYSLHDICRSCLPLHDICVQGTPCITSCSLGQPTSRWVLPPRDI